MAFTPYFYFFVLCDKEIKVMTDWRESTGAKLYGKAKKLIPGGTQLLSKRPEIYALVTISRRLTPVSPD
jgi:hypothetical protein